MHPGTGSLGLGLPRAPCTPGCPRAEALIFCMSYCHRGVLSRMVKCMPKFAFKPQVNFQEATSHLPHGLIHAAS